MNKKERIKMKAEITFVQYHTYSIEGKTEEECFKKAYEIFKDDMYYPVAHISYDEVKEVYTYKEESEE